VKTVSILGSTGSVGRQALEIIRAFPDRFRVAALAAGRDVGRLAGQAAEFKPAIAVVADEKLAGDLKSALAGTGCRAAAGDAGLGEAAAFPDSDIVLSAISGLSGFIPTLEAVRAGKAVALANKESLVAGGGLITAEAAKSGAKILPVDSEHSAIFQSLLGHNREDIRRLVLTASGGPFAGMTPAELGRVTPEQALNHPRWKMGPKVTIDSAMLMNKGFEVIEARWLFDIPAQKIEILIHRQSAVHSMVEYADGSVLAQMGAADMRIPIAYALSYPDRLPLGLDLDLCATGPLTFEKPDPASFPAYLLAYEALATGGTAPAALCAADEAAIEAFIGGRLGFPGMAVVMRKVLERHRPGPADSAGAVIAAAESARREAEMIIMKREADPC
jgi:1-deoxy-D-xylulose-5-phosphate reductoisomerase